MKDLFDTIRSSFYDPAFYARVPQFSIFSAIKIFALLGVVGFAVIGISLIPAAVDFANSDLPRAVKAVYPDDLTVSITDGKLSVNQPQPYYIKNTLPLISDGEDGPKNLVVFDGGNTLADDLQESSTLVLFKEKYLIAPGQNDQQQIIPLSKLGTTTVDKIIFAGWVDKVEPYFKPVVLWGGSGLLMVMLIFGTAFWIVFHLVYLLLPALVVFLFSKSRTKPYEYTEAYMIVAYASIPTAILIFLFEAIPAIPQISFLYTLVLFVFVIINIADRSNNTPTTEQS